MSNNTVKVTKVVHTTTGGKGIEDWTSDGWKQAIGGYGQSGNTIWLPQEPQQDLFSSGVTSRCYNRHCNNETRIITELKLGKFQLKTYICEICLADLAEKIKDELGIEEEEPKDV